MKQLDPKAVWLFFINSLIGYGFLGLIAFFFGFQFFYSSLRHIDEEFSGYAEYGGSSIPVPWGLIWGIILFVIVISLIISKLTYRYYKYELTDLVFKKEHGIIWKKYVSIPYDRIQNVDIYRGIWARLLGLSDIQIQTAGGITAGSYGAFSEGRLVGVSKEEAEKLRDELIQRARNSRTGQGL